MIVVEDRGNVLKSEDLTPQSFKIKASRKAFAILSDGLYSNKFEACVRELSTNAYDAHVAAGKPTEPFIVHLPNSLEPYFSVKDNGTGMSEDQVMNLYTTYFDSDKTNSNDFTGALGLGSKSPFSYTESFTVESRYNGVKTSYNAFINENGIPSIVKLSAVSTDENNGVEVKFSVATKDFYEFEKNAAKVLSWFSTKPEILGSSSFNFQEKNYMKKTEYYGLSSERLYSSHVVMGNVAYEIRANELSNAAYAAKSSIDHIERKVLEWGIDLFVPIGSVEITANREKLGYNAHTIETVKKILAKAITDISNDIEKDIQSKSTIWQARKALYDAHHSVLGSIRDVRSITWNGEEIMSYVPLKQYAEKHEVQVPVITHATQNGSKYRQREVDQLHADNTLIFYDDLPRGGWSRVLHKLKTDRIYQAYFINKADNEAFLKKSGVDEVIIRTSTLAKAPTKEVGSVRKKGARSLVNVYVSKLNGNPVDYWRETEIDASIGGIYVPTMYYKTQWPGNTDPIHPEIIGHVLGYLKTLGLGNINVYGIKQADVEKLKNRRWIHLHDFAKKVVNNYKHLKDKVKFHDCYVYMDDHSKSLSQFSLSDLQAGFTTIRQGSNFEKFVKLSIACKEAYSDKQLGAYISLLRKLDILPEESSEKMYTEFHDELHRSYPLLKYLDYYRITDDIKTAILHYVNLADGVKSGS